MDVVLVEPLIPQNTGSIARTCAATNTPLHIVGKPAFEISEKNVRRAGLDYWPFVNLTMHSTWEDYCAAKQPRKIWLIETCGNRVYYTADFGDQDALVFGKETSGLSQEILSKVPAEQILRIPITCSGVRSLNLSNSVSIALFEARRQIACSSDC